MFGTLIHRPIWPELTGTTAKLDVVARLRSADTTCYSNAIYPLYYQDLLSPALSSGFQSSMWRATEL